MKPGLATRLRIGAWAARLGPALALALVVAGEAEARPGGGHSYSGGGSSSGGGGGGGGGDIDVVALYYLIRLCFEYPPLGIAVLVIGVGFWLYNKRQEAGGGDWTAGTVDVSQINYPAPPPKRGRAKAPSRGSPRKELTRLKEGDPDFSIVVFEDFLYALYARAQEARGTGEVAPMAAYFGEAARESLTRRGAGLTAVETVVIGAMTYVDAQVPRQADGAARVRVRFEANYTERPSAGGAQTFYVVEEWTLTRPLSARSKPPEEAVAVGCPNCGAPLSNMRGEVCSYCDTRVGGGDFGWMVQDINLLDRERRGPQLTGTVAEAGTGLPTVRDADVVTELTRLRERDPAFTMQALEARVRLIFQEMGAAWSTLKWEKVRPYVSDGLFKTLLYWIEAYEAAGLRNLQDDAVVMDTEIARITTDRYYTALTLRVKASARDYTVDRSGRVVGGDKSATRVYTEYWTLLRGATSTGEIHTSPQCPSCGAPLNITMAGNCNHCQAKVTTGAFDWVLSRIEQDESYQP